MRALLLIAFFFLACIESKSMLKNKATRRSRGGYQLKANPTQMKPMSVKTARINTKHANRLHKLEQQLTRLEEKLTDSISETKSNFININNLMDERGAALIKLETQNRNEEAEFGDFRSKTKLNFDNHMRLIRNVRDWMDKAEEALVHFRTKLTKLNSNRNYAKDLVGFINYMPCLT